MNFKEIQLLVVSKSSVLQLSTERYKLQNLENYNIVFPNTWVWNVASQAEEGT